MKLAPYPKYKPSGFEWLGEVPAHWEVKRLKSVATYRVSNVDKVAVDDEVPIRLVNYTDVYHHDHIRPNMGLMETTATSEEVRRFGLEIGDVVITKDSEDWHDIAVPALVVESLPDLVCGYHLGILRPKKPQLLGSFLFRAFQTYTVNQQFQVAATGVTRYGLPKSKTEAAWLPLPSPQEQRTIADFLDRQTAKLDTLIRKKQALIERLQEKRAALITRTVTRGLPPEAARAAGLEPDPQMKASGVEWLGEVPAHWEVMKLRRLATLKSGENIISQELEEGSEYPVFGGNGIRGYSARFTHDGEYVLIGRQGALCGNINYASGRFWASEHAIVVSPTREFSARWMGELLRAMNLNQYSLSAAQPGLSVDRVLALSIPVPPVHEQRVIADFLDRETAKIDGLIAKVDTAIARLREYRAALITAAVTGQVDVRENDDHES